MTTSNYLRDFPLKMNWAGKIWNQWKQMEEIWTGNVSKLPLEIVFGNYLLRSSHSMLWIELVDPTRGEPFDIWEIRSSNLIDSDKDEIEFWNEEDWENILIESNIGIQEMTDLLKQYILTDYMVLYIQERKQWDKREAEQILNVQ